jgi:hypothetical protein
MTKCQSSTLDRVVVVGCRLEQDKAKICCVIERCQAWAEIPRKATVTW